MTRDDPKIQELLNQLSPSGTVLLDWMRPKIDDSILWDIAHADFGGSKDEYFNALIPIRDRQEIPKPLGWFAREPLILLSRCDPENPKAYCRVIQHHPAEYIPKTAGERGHWIRIFSCAVLLKATDDLETRDYIDNTEESWTLIQFVASALRLGPEATHNALRFLSWRILRLPSEHEVYPFFVMALLLLRASLYQSSEQVDDLMLLAGWVVAEEAQMRSGETWQEYKTEWLLGLNSSADDDRAWRRVTWNTLHDSAKTFPEPAASALRGIAERITPKQIVPRLSPAEYLKITTFLASEDRAIDALLHQYSPSNTALFDWLKPHIDDSMLQEIAGADYGLYKEEYFQALVPIRDDPKIPIPLEWPPIEVLETVHWYEVDSPSWNSSLNSEQGHWIRLFSCAILLKAGDAPEARDYTEEENSILIQLVDSALWLGNEATHNALRLLCWRILCVAPEDADDDYPFFVMAILILRVALFEAGQDPSELILIVNWVIAAEARARNDEKRSLDTDEWLLGLTNRGQKHDRWRKVASAVLLNPTKNIPEPAASALRGIAERILPRLS
jgi:hypothetical protein